MLPDIFGFHLISRWHPIGRIQYLRTAFSDKNSNGKRKMSSNMVLTNFRKFLYTLPLRWFSLKLSSEININSPLKGSVSRSSP